jgi:hypothetical protein
MLAALVLRRQREAAAALATFDVLFLLGLIVSVIARTLARASPRVLAAGRTLAAALAVVAVDPEIFAKGLASLASRPQLWRVGHGWAGRLRTLALDPRDTPWFVAA